MEKKFRIWADNKMDYSPVTFTEWLNDNFVFDGYDKGKEPIIMQFTGLKDKYDVEIYEGDIIKYTGWDKRVYTQACPDISHFHFYEETRDNPTCEVIGNIYESNIQIQPTISEVTEEEIDLQLSVCCGAEITEQGLCSDCKEHVK